MRTLLAIALMSLVGCATVSRSAPSDRHEMIVAEEYSHAEGSGGGFPMLPPLRLAVFGQAEAISPTDPSYAGALYGKTLTITGATTLSTLQTTSTVTVGTNAGSTIRAAGYGIGNNASNSIGVGLGATSVDYRTLSPTGTHTFQNKDGASTYATIGPGSVGVITLVAGSGTATVTTGMQCVCTDKTANASVKCVVSGTTLTATGTTTDQIVYVCL